MSCFHTEFHLEYLEEVDISHEITRLSLLIL